MNDQVLKKLYDKVSAKYDIGNYESFKKKMQTPEGRKRFHTKVSQKFDIGTFESMEIKLMGTGCLSKIAKNKVQGEPGVYKLGNTTYKFYNSGYYESMYDSGGGPKGTWACNSKGFIELNGKESSLGGTQTPFNWVQAPTEEEVKTGKVLLKSGMRGDFVTKVQQQLKVKGVDPKGVDGKFGKNTKNAVIKFQETVELNKDGVVGPKTYQELFFEVPKVEPTNVQNQEPLQQPVEQPGLNPVYEPKAPQIQRQQATVPPLTNREQRKANRMTPKQQNAHVDPKPTIKESLKVTLAEKKQEKENLLIESKIISNRFNILSEGLEITTNEQKIKFVDTISEELNYLTTQGYSSKVINEGLFSFLGSLFGGSVKSVPAVFGEYIAQWLTKKLGIPEGSFMQSSIVALVGNLNISDYDKFFTDCRFASNKIADSLIEGYLIQMQQRAQATSQGATGFITSAMRNAISEYFLEDKEGIVQKLQDMIGDFLCPKLSKVASTLQDKAEDIKDKAVA
jgi:peptidoglycan hydrolase-like protein with peptidoglycan-binding domain